MYTQNGVKITLILTAFSVLASVSIEPVSAAFIVDGNHVFVRTELKAAQCPTYCSPTLGAVDTITAAIDEQSLDAFGRETRAAASVTADGTLTFKVKASSSAPNATSSITPTAQARAEAIYRDVFLPSADGAPAQLALQFAVHGELQVSQTTDAGIGI